MLQDFADSHPVSVVIAIFVIAILSFVGWNNFVFSGVNQLSNDARVIAAMITASGAIFGVLISGVVALVRDRWGQLRERQEIATALLTELYNQCDAVANCGSISNATLASGDQLSQEKFEIVEPVDPLVFMAIASRISILPHDAARPTIAFYASLQAARALTRKLPEAVLRADGLYTTSVAPDWRQNNIAQSWRMAALNGVVAISSLERLSQPNKKG